MNLLRQWVETPGAAALGFALAHSLWEGAVAALALAAALAVLRSARARYAAGCAALLLVLAAFGFTLVRSMPQARMRPAWLARPADLLGAVPSGESERVVAAPGAADYLPWLAPLWMAGVLCFQLRGVAGWMGARRLRRAGVCAAPGMWRTRLDRLARRVRVSRRVVLLESCLAEVPVLIGYLRPAILVPVGLLAGLPPSQVEAILLHELAHVRRHDYLVNLLQMFAESLVFYHPAVWWMSAVIRAERENCCDDMVVSTQGDAFGYASALAALEERRAVAAQAALAFTGGSLVKRIRRLLAPPEGPRAGLTPVFSSLVLAVTLVGALAAWQTRPAAGAPLQEPRPDTRQTSPYRQWLTEDVVYIIADEERAAFRRLASDAEREQFIEQFWLRRDPTPDTVRNEFKEEHYRRIAYANQLFAARDLPGWKTDRGRIYITYGPPDERESHPSGGSYQKPAAQAGGATSTFPFEQWLYHTIEGVGRDVIVEFVDPTLTGEYRMTVDPAAKDAQHFIPGAVAEAMQAGATVQPVGINGVLISVPLDRYGDRPVHVNAVIRTKDRGLVKAFDNTFRGQAAFTQFLALTPGAYRLSVVVKDVATGKLAADEIAFEVK